MLPTTCIILFSRFDAVCRAIAVAQMTKAPSKAFPTRNGPQRTELTTAEDVPWHAAAMLHAGAREHTR